MDNQELQALNADLTMDKVGGLTLSFVASASQIAQSVEARAHIHKAREVKNKEKWNFLKFRWCLFFSIIWKQFT